MTNSDVSELVINSSYVKERGKLRGRKYIPGQLSRYLRLFPRVLMKDEVA